MEGLFGCVNGVAHSFQRVDVLQAAASLLFFLSSYLGQFLQENSKIHQVGTGVVESLFNLCSTGFVRLMAGDTLPVLASQ